MEAEGRRVPPAAKTQRRRPSLRTKKVWVLGSQVRKVFLGEGRMR